MSVHLLDLPADGHLDFAYARETYVIYPWVRDGDELVRPLRIGPDDAHVAVARIAQRRPDLLQARVDLPDDLPDAVDLARTALARCLQLDYPRVELERHAATDPVLKAACDHRGMGRGKLYPDLFEALCGVICAQRTSFARVYSMMRKLAEAFGTPTGETVDDTVVHTFPTPAMMAAATDEELRACSVGFRAKGLAAASSVLAQTGYTWWSWKDRPTEAVIEDLLAIKGVGPYTANLAVNLAYGHGGHAHVDTYVVDVIGNLYLDDPQPSPERVAQFVTRRWGDLGETVLDLLTTDTEQWAPALGKNVGVRSGARA